MVVTVQGNIDTYVKSEKNPYILGTYILVKKTSNKPNNIINMVLIKQ